MGADFYFFPSEKARFFAFTPQKSDSAKSVKYDCPGGIKHDLHAEREMET